MAEWAENADKIEEELENDPNALAEYLAALVRINVKLSNVNF